MKKLMLLLPVLSGVLWGSAGIFVRRLDAFEFDNCTMIFIRIVVAVLMLFLGILLIDRAMLKIRIKDIWVFVVCGVFGILGLNLCYNQAIAGLTLSLAAVLLSMSPVFVMVLATFVLKEKITVKKIACTVMAVFGCVLVSGVLESGTGITISAAGVLAGIVAAFFYALYSIFSKVAMKRRYNVFTITFYSMLTGTIVLIPFADWEIMGRFAAESPVENTVFILVNALFTSILPYILYTLSLSHVDAGKVSILAAGGEPSSAMVFGMIFFSEKPTVLSLCGLAVTILALWLLCVPGKAEREAAESKGGTGADVEAGEDTEDRGRKDFPG